MPPSCADQEGQALQIIPKSRFPCQAGERLFCSQLLLVFAGVSLLLVPVMQDQDSSSIDKLNLSTRGYNCLRRSGLHTVAQVAALSDEELLSIRNLGRGALIDIRQKLAAYLSEHPLPEITEGMIESKPLETPLAIEPSPSGLPPLPPDPTPLSVLGLSARPHNALKWAGITTIGQLTAMSREQIREVRSIGEKALAEIESKLEAYLADPSRFKAPAVMREPPPPPTVSPPESEIPGTPTDEQTLAVQVGKWLSGLTDRQLQVICRRYGLHGSEPETLEEVGQCLGITRERVRQIQFKSLERLRSPRRRQQVHPWATLLYQTFIETGGLCTEERLGQAIAEATDTTGIDVQGVARLILETYGIFREVKGIKGEEIWGLSDAPLKLVPAIHQQMVKILRNEHAPLPFGEVLARFKAPRLYQDHCGQLDDTFVEACLRVHPDIDINDKGLYALTKWSSRRLHEIIQALRKLGKPSHYSKIAETINAELPPERHITDWTVHNQLVQHPELFVWVGRRGTYGLKEWGLERSLSYEEAIARILQRASHPLTFQQILAQLPALRSYYDESSIVLTLGTNERFRSFPGDTYGLAEWREDEVVTEDYRLKRLLEGVEVASSPTKLKPTVVEELNSVDSFIAQARERASDGR